MRGTMNWTMISHDFCMVVFNESFKTVIYFYAEMDLYLVPFMDESSSFIDRLIVWSLAPYWQYFHPLMTWVCLSKSVFAKAAKAFVLMQL